MAVQQFRELVAWQKAMDLVAEVYRLTKVFPREEIYGLTNPVRRAAVAVPSNIAEGQGRGPGSSFANFLRIAYGSLQEVQTQILIAERLQYIDSEQVRLPMELSDEVGRIIKDLLRSLDNGP
ncbi:MAG TPA: four helix bundle protein [Tepidisphaeraceae bacterium]|jgi:four helix bundle protein|nr:four helix bundle protein [Tepidisphaeraceae bacterium]